MVRRGLPRRSPAAYVARMTYPDPAYTGSGEASARFRPAATPPDLPRRGGTASYAHDNHYV